MKRESIEERFERMAIKENQLYKLGFKAIAGVDEVGRGPLAGPVAVGICVLDPKKRILGLNDSKKISAPKRQQLNLEIKASALTYSVAMIGPSDIDKLGINEAIKLATKEALSQLSIKPDYFLFDYVSWELDQKAEKIKKGDSNINCIAAASILAKCVRDEYMVNMASKYPLYDWEHNMGYGTKRQLEALQKYGLSPLHRRSYCKKYI